MAWWFVSRRGWAERPPVNARLVEIAHQIESGGLAADPSNAELLRSLLD